MLEMSFFMNWRAFQCTKLFYKAKCWCAQGNKKETQQSMARVVSLPLFLLSWLLLFSFPASSTSPRKEDIPYIKCQLCEKIVHQIHRQVQKKENKISLKKMSELEIMKIVDNVCNLEEQEAEWIFYNHIVEKGAKLELEEQGVEGQCNSECKTIEKACQEVIEIARTDVAKFFYKKRPSNVELVNHGLCHKLFPDDCPTRPFPTDRLPSGPFVPKTSNGAEIEKDLKENFFSRVGKNFKKVGKRLTSFWKKDPSKSSKSINSEL